MFVQLPCLVELIYLSIQLSMRTPDGSVHETLGAMAAANHGNYSDKHTCSDRSPMPPVFLPSFTNLARPALEIAMIHPKFLFCNEVDGTRDWQQPKGGKIVRPTLLRLSVCVLLVCYWDRDPDIVPTCDTVNHIDDRRLTLCTSHKTNLAVELNS